MVAFEMTQEVTVGLSLPDIALCRLDGEKIHQLTFDLSITDPQVARPDECCIRQSGSASDNLDQFI